MSTNGVNLYIERLKSNDLGVVLGAEIEFYLSKDSDMILVKKELDSLFSNKDLKIKKESAELQYEIAFYPSEVDVLLSNLIKCKTHIEKITDDKNNKISNFLPKPFAKKPGNGMHFHINLKNKSNQNAFDCDKNLLLYSIAGILEITKQNASFFISTSQEKERIDNRDIHTPQRICWGKNNRTAAIRLITTKNEVLRIEHRLASSTHCPEKTVEIILEGILYGIEKKIYPPEPIFGISSDPIYKLPPMQAN